MANSKEKFGEWKWDKASGNALTLVSQFFGFNSQSIQNATDESTKAILQQADASDTQVKRVQDFARGQKKIWRNNLRIGATIHGLVRSGLGMILEQRRIESTTAKEYAKTITGTSVLDAKTKRAIETTYHKGSAQIKGAEEQLNLKKQEIDTQYSEDSQVRQTQSQQRLGGYRERAQKRLTANARPWRNY